MHFLIYIDLVQEVPPLDLNELLAYFLKQSGPLFDQLGIKRGKRPYFSLTKSKVCRILEHMCVSLCRTDFFLFVWNRCV